MKPYKKIRNIKCRRDIMQYNEYILNCILLYSVFNGSIPTKIMIPQICAPAAALYYAFCPAEVPAEFNGHGCLLQLQCRSRDAITGNKVV